jgi:hypothetical protein
MVSYYRPQRICELENRHTVLRADELKLKLEGLVNNFAQLIHQNFVIMLQFK